MDNDRTVPVMAADGFLPATVALQRLSRRGARRQDREGDKQGREKDDFFHRRKAPAENHLFA